MIRMLDGSTAELPCKNATALSPIGEVSEMNSRTHGSPNIVAAIGLAVAVIFGLAGTFVTNPGVQNTLWEIDSVGFVMATALLTLKYFRQGNDIVAAGFLVFAIGEGVLLSGTAAGLVGGVPAFAAGTALWATALLLISIPNQFAAWVRIAGVAASLLVGMTATAIYWGEQLLPTSSPLPFLAYPVLSITVVGWIWTLLREMGLIPSMWPTWRDKRAASKSYLHAIAREGWQR
jgi:hypothetical protein